MCNAHMNDHERSHVNGIPEIQSTQFDEKILLYIALYYLLVSCFTKMSLSCTETSVITKVELVV